jgi:glycosyltransferase involved in cell wall biosynthesis
MTISLVTIVHNRKEWLTQTLESVLLQTIDGSEIEYIVWSDGSTDGSDLIAANYAERFKDSGITYRVISNPHLGFAPSLALALEQTSGEFLGWIDSDDALHPHCLSSMLNYFDQEPLADMVYSYHTEVDSDFKMLGLGMRCQIHYSALALMHYFMLFHFRLIRRSIYDKVGGVDSFAGTAPDYDLCLKISEQGVIKCNARSLYYWRKHDNNMSSNLAAMEQGQTYALGRAADRRVELNLRSSVQAITSAATQINHLVRLQKGIVIVAVGARYLELAIECARSIKQYSDLSIALVTTENLSLSQKTNFQMILTTKRSPFGFSNEQEARLLKGASYWLSPFNETIYLDADTVCRGDIDCIWQFVGGAQIAMTKDAIAPMVGRSLVKGVEKSCTVQRLGSDYPQYSGGVLVWRRSLHVQEFFRNWLAEWLVWCSVDQLALARALHRSKIIPVTLPPEFNVTSLDCKAAEGAIVVHHLASQSQR